LKNMDNRLVLCVICALRPPNWRASPHWKQAKHVGQEENQQYSAEPYACPPAVAPAAVAIEPAAATQNQKQNDKQ